MALLSMVFLTPYAIPQRANALVAECSIVTSGSPPTGSTHLATVTMTVTNDEDTGFVGYWALDSYTKTIDLWQTSPGNFYALVTYSGTWETFAGALSPQNGVNEPFGGSGPMNGGYIWTFTGTLLATYPTSGSLGTFNLGGSSSDILLQTYAHQSGNPTSASWVSHFFSTTSAYNPSPWGWAYTYSGATGTQTWCNSSVTSFGDIVTNQTPAGVPEFSVPIALVASISLLGLALLRRSKTFSKPKVHS